MIRDIIERLTLKWYNRKKTYYAVISNADTVVPKNTRLYPSLKRAFRIKNQFMSFADEKVVRIRVPQSHIGDRRFDLDYIFFLFDTEISGVLLVEWPIDKVIKDQV